MKREELLYIKKRLQELKKERDKSTNFNSEEELQQSNQSDYNLLLRILNNFKLSETNGIYVCTDAYYFSQWIGLLDSETYSVQTAIDFKGIDGRFYCDVEDNKFIVGTMDKEEALRWKGDRYYIPDFEKEHIILNPYNTPENLNGYFEVKKDFWENAVKYGQEKAKKLILNKYPRL